MKKLILAEKPSVAREIARVLGCNQNIQGGIMGSNYIVTWALGHLVTLKTPEEMNKEWETWKLETLPMIPSKFETKVIKDTSKQFQNVKALLKNNDVSELIIATDAGREGELVARWIINKVGFNKPIKRLWISSMTDKAIKNGFSNLQSSKNYDNLYYSAESRAIADWLVGLNVTRALTCKYNAQLSAGRVQTPTLAMITSREEEINKFVPKEYYQILLKIKGVEFIYQEKGIDKRIFNKEEALKLIEDIKSKEIIVSNISKTEKRELPPLLYDLTSLQQDANRLYSLSPKQTLDIIQKLYEVDKYLTYPRTDSKYLTSDMYETIKERLLTITNMEYNKYVKEILSKPLIKSKRIFDDSKVTDHHAIILTEQKTNLFNLSLNEKRIYDLVMKRFISAFLTDYIYEKVTIELKVGDLIFKANGKKEIDKGFKRVYLKEELESDDLLVLPEFRLNEKFRGVDGILKKGLTKAPDRYTEASLLAAMEHPSKFVEPANLQKVLQLVSGIGTPATRADIIERIFNAGYVELRGRSIYPTEKGKQLINLVPNFLKSPSLTAEWELKLSQIEKGLYNKQTFIKEIEANTSELIDEVLNTKHTYKHENMVKTKCPNCGNPLLEINNKYGTSLVCSNRECNYKKQISKNTFFLCPICKRKLQEIESKEKKVLICKCGYKENKDSCLLKLNNNKGEMNKKSLDNYLRNQNKEIPTNNPFLDIFNTLKK